MTREAKVLYTAQDLMGPASASARKNLMSVAEAAGLVTASVAAMGGAVTLAGVTAMVKRINDSVDALNDLKDATGASIENISALENVARATGSNFDTVGTSLVKFNQALGATMKPGSDAEKVLKAIGLNAKTLREIDPAEALRQTAVALSKFADDGNKARAVQELFGKSLREVAPFLKDLAEQGQLVATVTTKQAEEAEKFNKELYKLQAGATTLARDLANPLVTAINEVVDAFRRGQREGVNFLTTLGSIMRHAPGLPGLVGGVLSLTMGDVPTLASDRAEAARLKRRLGASNITTAQSASLSEQLAQIQSRIDQGEARLELEREARRGTGTTRSIKVPGEKTLEEAAKREMEHARRVAEERQRLRLKEEKEIEEFFRRQEELEREAVLARKRLQEGLYETLQDLEQKSLAAIYQRIHTIEEEEATLGMLASAVTGVTLARMRDMRAAMAAGAESLESIDRQIEALERLQRAQAGKEMRERSEQTLRSIADAGVAASAQIGQSLLEHIMRSGRSAAQYLKDLFRSLVLQPMLQPLGQAMGSVVNGVTQPIVNGAMNALGFTNMGASVASAFMGGYTGIAGLGAATTATATMGGFMAPVGTMLATDLTGATVLAGAAGASGTGGVMAGLSAAAGAIPVAGWIALGLMALASMAGGGETRSGGFYRNGAFVHGPSGGQLPGMQDAAVATMGGINSMLASLGSTDRLQEFLAAGSTSENNRGNVWAGGTLTSGATFGEWSETLGNAHRQGSRTPEQLAQDYGTELQRATLQALQVANVPGILGEYLRGLGDVELLNLEQVEAAIGRVTTAIAQKEQLEERLYMLTHTDLEILARARERELAATDESNRALLQRIHTLEDERAATEAATAAAAAREQGIAEFIAGATRMWNAQQESAQRAAEVAAQWGQTVSSALYAGLQAGVTGAQQRLDQATTILRDAYGREVASLQQVVDSNLQRAGTLREARMALWASSALSRGDRLTAARAALGGINPDNATSLVSNYLEAFGSRAGSRMEMLRETARGAGLLQGQENTVRSAAAAAQRQIDAMNALMGSVDGLNRTISFQTALLMVQDAKRALGVANYALNSAPESDEARMVRFHMEQAGMLGMGLDQYIAQTFPGQQKDAWAYYNSLSPTVLANDALWEQLVPSYAKGVSSVPRNMLAMIHEGERILPRDDNADLVEELRRSRAANEAATVAIERMDSFLRQISPDGLSIKVVVVNE